MCGGDRREGPHGGAAFQTRVSGHGLRAPSELLPCDDGTERWDADLMARLAVTVRAALLLACGAMACKNSAPANPDAAGSSGWPRCSQSATVTFQTTGYNGAPL